MEAKKPYLKVPESCDTVQIGGTHYKEQAIEPWNYIYANGLGYFEGNAIKYITRWKAKGGLSDLEKAIHYIAKLIELEKEKSP